MPDIDSEETNQQNVNNINAINNEHQPNDTSNENEPNQFTNDDNEDPHLDSPPKSINHGDDVSSNEGDEHSQSTPEFNNKRIILQRYTVYNSLTTMYIVGSNAKETLFRILEISKDTVNEDELMILEDKSYFYTRKDMVELLNGLDESIEGGVHKIAQGYGLLGFIRFTKDYYLSIITKCSQVAILGGHLIYHIDETKLIPLEINYKRPAKYSDEERLLSIFKYLDLGKTFYFSYAYDVTNSLQTNFMRHKQAATEYNLNQPASNINENFKTFDHNERFVWNNVLLKPVLENQDIATYEWFQPIIHGFIDQAKISVYGKCFYITIIARRSHHFAGARFLKRGVNDKGNVANEIETEQIVSDMLLSSFHDPKYGFYNSPRYSSFVQHRGSIPLYWTQDLNRLPKPPIEINLSDPFYQSSAIHFNNLFERYGSPVIILNLIKQKEKQPRESKLNQHFVNCIKYLNQFLPAENKLRYYSFDMSKNSKKNLDVITPLQSIAAESIKTIGFFHNGHDLESTKLQTGIIRTNCIDCLDRTNAAQFITCKEALTYQLRSLDLIPQDKTLEYDSDLINILTEIFHDHGDTIAVQYGGSNLVNTMDSYRRINQWSSHTRDILNSVKRIYSNSFMDSIRQEAINLFLGNYIYSPDKPKLWELQNDFYLHNDMSIDNIRKKVSYIQWFNKKYLSDQRFKYIESPNPSPNIYWDESWKLEPFPDYNDNWFNECYVPRKFTSFADVLQFKMNSNARYFPTNLSLESFDYSPFEPRLPKNGDESANKEALNGESNLRYLDKCAAGELTDTSRKRIENSEEVQRYDMRNNKHYLHMTHPNKIKKFLANKIERFAYNNDSLRGDINDNSSTCADSQDSREEDSTYGYYTFSDHYHNELTKPTIREEDYLLYKAQPSFQPKISYDYDEEKVNTDAFSFYPTSNDSDIYNFYCNLVSNSNQTGENFDNGVNISQLQYHDAQDLRIYSQYLGIDDEKLISLNTEDNYFR
ncbi:SacI homology domain-containing protein [Scheffersomyces coipomensis]|uniref:SacI homology domain-containing protein n=1 Tax=Scheffersomyces coipomensis TaxID=1788519 RepID=UPI00315C4DD3